MARLRKVFIRDATYFITFRAEAGLPLPATKLMRRILEGILCKAQSLYNVAVGPFGFMANHAHMLVTVTSPELVDDFIMYVKRESAHAVNRLLGRRKRTVWCKGYDSPIVLDLEKLLDITAYIYTNPVEACLVDRVEDSPGFSSWEMFINRRTEIRSRRLSRRGLPVIGTSSISLSTQDSLIDELEGKALEENTFTFSPYAFRRSFHYSGSEEELRELIINRVRAREASLRTLRKTPLPSRLSLITSGINLDYAPKKFGKRMICHSSDKKLRISFISWFKDLCRQGYELYQAAKGKISEMILPPGLFYPGGGIRANIWGAVF